MFGGFVPLPSGGFIANGRGPGTAPLLHITDDGAATELSTGDLSQFSTDSTGYRVLGPSRGGGIWYGAQSPHRFFALSSQHEVVDRLDVNRDWFQEFPGLTLIALHEDSRGNLWAYFLFDGGREVGLHGPLDSLFSSLIAVYDVEAHRLLAHHVDDRALTPVAGRPEVVHFVETGIGDIEALLQRMSLIGGAR